MVDPTSTCSKIDWLQGIEQTSFVFDPTVGKIQTLKTRWNDKSATSMIFPSGLNEFVYCIK